MTNNAHHQPVLKEAAVEVLAPEPHDTYLDMTAGFGGHAAAVEPHLGENGSMILVDRDQAAIRALKQRFPKARLLHESFLAASQKLLEENQPVDMVLFDLGVSTPQLDNSDRGFSFQEAGPLDMRMDQRMERRARDVINNYSQSQLANLLGKYGEERHSQQVAQAVVNSRPVTTTTELAEIVAEVVPRSGRIHPATRTFQALRIAVNDELGQLEMTLPKACDLLSGGGRLAVISFHSLEDRIVKQEFNQQLQTGNFTDLTPTPITGRNQDSDNPQARSAKLRAIKKQKHNRR